jgi:hypothetical protein
MIIWLADNVQTRVGLGLSNTCVKGGCRGTEELYGGSEPSTFVRPIRSMRHAGVIGTDLTAHVSFLIGFVRFRHLTTWDAGSYRPKMLRLIIF